MEDISNNPHPQLKVEDSVLIQLQNTFKVDETTTTSNHNKVVLNSINNEEEEVVGEAVERSRAVYLNDNDEIECLPGYRFNPFDDELIVYYLRNKVMNMPLPHNKIKEVELYKYNPEEITKNEQGLVDKEWYFFTPRDRKYKNGSRPNRAAGNGYWKATGADKNVYHDGHIVGHRKALVFYEGKAPKGDKTNWIMHEFRIDEKKYARQRTSEHDMRLDDWVLCRIYKKDDKHRKAPKQNHSRYDNSDDISSPPSESVVPPPSTATTENAVSPYSNFSNFRRGNPSPLIIGHGHRNVENPSPLTIANGYRNPGNPPLLMHNGYHTMEHHSTGFRDGNDLPIMTNDQYQYTDPCFHNNPHFTNPSNPSYRYVPQSFSQYQDNFENFEHDDWGVEPLLDNFNGSSHMENLDTMFLTNSSHNEVIVVQNNNSQMQTPSNAGSSS